LTDTKDLKKLRADLKAVYSVPTEQAGRDALEDFGKIWNGKYPIIHQAWDQKFTGPAVFRYYSKT
jgi:transposase-like protein